MKTIKLTLILATIFYCGIITQQQEKEERIQAVCAFVNGHSGYASDAEISDAVYLASLKFNLSEEEVESILRMYNI